MAEVSKLNLDGLHERHPGLTPALGDSYTEAACVCLARHHEPPVSISVLRGGGLEHHNVNFTVPDVRTLNAHANQIDATETGAYCVSLAAVEIVADLIAVRRAETLTGADWYVAPKNAPIYDFETCVRLEVSGTDSGTSHDVQRILLEKIAQTARGKSNLPAIASVVGFKALEIAISPLGGKE